MLESYRVATPQGAHASVASLATEVADVIRGYETMQDRADDDLKPVIERLHALHTTHASALVQVLERLGGTPDNLGSIKGVVHSVVATARDWVGALDASAVPQLIEGEKQIINSYTAAIDTLSEEPRLRGLLEDQRTVLRGHIAALET